jgi:hypothetical protein
VISAFNFEAQACHEGKTRTPCQSENFWASTIIRNDGFTITL